MGRFTLVRTLVTTCLGALACSSTSLKASALDPVPVAVTSADAVDDLVNWLDQLCIYVHCVADRSPLDDSISRSDWIVVRFVVSYESYGLRQDLSKQDLDRAYVLTRESLELLMANPDELDPEIAKALFLSLASMEAELID